MNVLEYQHKFIEDAENITGAISDEFPEDLAVSVRETQMQRQNNLPVLLDYGNSIAADIQDVRNRLCVAFGVEDADIEQEPLSSAQLSRKAVKESKPSFFLKCSAALMIGVLGMCAIMFM